MIAKRLIPWAAAAYLTALASAARASEADIKIPDLSKVTFDGLGGMSGISLMYVGIAFCVIGAIFGLIQYRQTKALPVHSSMGSVSNTIWETCKTYLFTQGKFLAILWLLLADRLTADAADCRLSNAGRKLLLLLFVLGAITPLLEMHRALGGRYWPADIRLTAPQALGGFPPHYFVKRDGHWLHGLLRH